MTYFEIFGGHELSRIEDFRIFRVTNFADLTKNVVKGYQRIHNWYIKFNSISKNVRFSLKTKQNNLGAIAPLLPSEVP